MKKTQLIISGLAAATMLLPVTASADDHMGVDDKPFYFRAGMTFIRPDSSSTEVSLEVSEEVAAANAYLASINMEPAVHPGEIEGSGISVGDANIPTATLGYVLPYADGHLSVETILGLPYTVDINHEGTLADEPQLGLPVAFGEKLGETKALSPAVSLVYKFMLEEKFRPYVGGGLAYLLTYDSEVTNQVIQGAFGGDAKMEIDNGLGYLFQFGAEYNVYENWFVTADVKYVGGLELDAEVNNLTVPTSPGTTALGLAGAPLGKNTTTVTVDPWAYSIGAGFSF